MIEKRADGPTWRRAWRQRGRWENRWAGGLLDVLEDARRGVDVERLVRSATRRPTGRRTIVKAGPSPEDVVRELRAQVSETEVTRRLGVLYATLALQEGEDSGQATLDALGLHSTFEWAGIRDFARNPFAVRGSKVIQSVYGEHLDRLARLVILKTDPAKPQTVGELAAAVQRDWPDVTRKHAMTIARTESAYVWETTNWNALALNEVEEVEWLIATGPSVGPPKSYEVCEVCLLRASRSPYAVASVTEIPPLHPNCRCTVVQSYDPDWLPPARPWTGAAGRLEIFA